MSKLALAVVVLIALAVVLSGLFLERIPPAVIGVKYSQLGGGIVEKDFKTGYHIGVIGIHKWNRLDGRVHFITFSEEQRRTGLETNVDYEGSIDIRTRDNNTASLDVTVTYQIMPDRGWRLVSDALEVAYRDRVLRAVRGLLVEELSKLSPEDFVNTETRTLRVQETMPLLRKSLEKYHVEPLTILIRAVRFPPEYENKLQLKQLTRQNAFLAEAKQRQEQQQQVTESFDKETEAQTKRARAQWDVRLQEERSANEVAIAQINADARLYDKQTRAEAEASFVKSLAEGELALAKAEALRNELRNAALDTPGGRILLARQAAENLRIGDVTLNSNDPDVPTILDVSELVELLVGSD